MHVSNVFGTPGGRRNWRSAELLALAGTIPAFYLSVLASDRLLAMSLYLLACAASLVVILREAGTPAQRAAHHGTFASHRLGLVLALGLLVSALLPAGDAPFVLTVRLATAALIVLRLGESIRPWFWRGGLPNLLALAIGVMGLCGLGFWWLEPQARTFGDGLWLAFTTAATVGYGDIVPSTPAAKIFAVFVVLMGVAVLSLVTAAIAATWVQTEERKIEREILRDLHRQIQGIRDELALARSQSPPPPPSPSPSPSPPAA